MDNFKISCEKQWIKIQTIPEIKCDIEGWVKRDGRLLVSGEGNTLHFSFPIKTILFSLRSISLILIITILFEPSLNLNYS
jgi:hypothetical protein